MPAGQGTDTKPQSTEAGDAATARTIADDLATSEAAW